METGLIHIYYGDGKGKTSASIGLGVRCKGNGFKVLYCSFLKNTCSGEHKAMAGVDIQKCDFFDKFCFYMDEAETLVAREKTLKYYKNAIVAAIEKDYDMLILDEILDAVDVGYIAEADLERFLKEKPQNLEVVLTGRKASDNLKNIAHYISEIKCVKHPYNDGVQARKGIEL